MAAPKCELYHRMPDRRSYLRAVVILALLTVTCQVAIRSMDYWLGGMGLLATALAYWAAGLWVMHRVAMKGEPVWWRLGSHNLTALYLGWCRSYPWRSIERVDDTDDGAVLRTARGDVRLGRGITNWRLMAASIRRRIGQDEPPVVEDRREVTIPPERVAEWLGLAPGEALVVKNWEMLLVWLTLSAMIALCGWLAAAARSWTPLVIAVVMAPIGYAGVKRWLWQLNSTASEARADGEVLAAHCPRGWRRFAWGSVLAVERRPDGHLVRTLHGDVILGWLCNKRRLLSALEQAIAAREQGEVLPRLVGGEASEAALSRAVGESGASERGVSRADLE